jgi:hypothetical protein
MNKIIYSAMIGGYDEIRPVSKKAGWECVMFTDMPKNKLPAGTGWEFRAACLGKRMNNVLVNRWYKMHPHVLIPDHEERIYIDAKIQLNDFEIIEKQISFLEKDDVSIAITDHLFRNCIYQEAIAVVEHKKDIEKNVALTMHVLKKIGYPKNHGLYENNFIYRKHKHPMIIELMRQWWSFINKYSSRDQLSLCYLMWLNGINAEYFYGQGESVRNNQDITFYPNHSDTSTATSSHAKLISPKLRLCLFLCKFIPGKNIRTKLRQSIRN